MYYFLVLHSKVVLGKVKKMLFAERPKITHKNNGIYLQYNLELGKGKESITCDALKYAYYYISMIFTTCLTFMI